MRLSPISRRTFLQGSCAAVGLGLSLGGRNSAFGSDVPSNLIAEVDSSVIFFGRQAGPSWFHPRPCVVGGSDGPTVLMTLQLISGSDVFGPVHWTTTSDLGTTWSKPEPIPGLGRRSLGDGWEIGVCDVVPEYHAKSDTVLAVGHDVYYEDGVLARPQRERRPVYVVRSNDGVWSSPQHLEWDDPRTSAIFTCGCSQRVNLPDGEVLIPLSFGPKGRTHRSVTTVRCTFDGERLAVKQVGNELTNTAGRGLLEPSITAFDGRFYMTLRAEDGKGYVSVSDDGLAWQEPQPWCWEDGTPLVMSTTQQHWLPHSDGLFLVYNREAETNAKVMRYRAPLFVAAVDLETNRLIRASEQVALPLIGDGVNDPKHVALMGNFHTLAVTPEESWVTVGEHRPYDGYKGDTLLARVRWSRENEMAPKG